MRLSQWALILSGWAQVNAAPCSRPRPCSIRYLKMELMPQSAERAGTRKNLAPRNAFFLSAMPSANGTLKIRGLNCGVFITAESTKARASVFPLSNWTELDVWEYIRHE